MTIIELLLMGLALSLDAFAVALTVGICTYNIPLKQRQRFILFIGIAHFVMVLLGWSLWGAIQNLVSEYDHWIASALLAFVGIKMIVETLKADDNNGQALSLSLRNTIFLSIVLSIDAIVSGFSLGIIPIHIGIDSPFAAITVAALIIGVCSALISSFGIAIGNRIGKRIGSKAGLFGGLVLVALGAKVLIDHLSH